MSLLNPIRKRWRHLAPRRPGDVEEEFQSTLDAYRQDLVRQGFSEEEANSE